MWKHDSPPPTKVLLIKLTLNSLWRSQIDKMMNSCKNHHVVISLPLVGLVDWVQIIFFHSRTSLIKHLLKPHAAANHQTTVFISRITNPPEFTTRGENMQTTEERWGKNESYFVVLLNKSLKNICVHFTVIQIVYHTTMYFLRRDTVTKTYLVHKKKWFLCLCNVKGLQFAQHNSISDDKWSRLPSGHNNLHHLTNYCFHDQ